MILDASEFEFVIVDSVGVFGRDFRSFRLPLNFNRRSQLVDDGLSNESYYDFVSNWQSANDSPCSIVGRRLFELVFISKTYLILLFVIYLDLRKSLIPISNYFLDFS